MRIRQIKPEFWSDARLYRLDPVVKLIYIGLWNEADDSGFLRWEPMQLALDLLPDVDLASGQTMIVQAGDELEARGRIRRYKCGHAAIPTLPKNQHLAGATKQVHTIRREHDACNARRRGSPRVPADPRPVRLGKVRLGQVSEGNRASAQEDRTDPVETWAAVLRGPVNGAVRERAVRELDKLGYHQSPDGSIVPKGAT